MKIKFDQLSKILKIIWTWLYEKKYFAFSFLLAALIVKNRPTVAWAYSTSLTKHSRPKLKAFNTKFGPQWKDWENFYQIRQVLLSLPKLVFVILF